VCRNEHPDNRLGNCMSLMCKKGSPNPLKWENGSCFKDEGSKAIEVATLPVGVREVERESKNQ